MKALLWDLDDTLVDTLEARMDALGHAYRTCVGSTCDPIELWRSWKGGTLESLGRHLVGDRAQEFTDAFHDHYDRGSRTVRVYEGIEDTLLGSRDAGLVLGVVTSRVSWWATDALSRSGLLQHFRAVVAQDDTDSHKPDPEPVLAALDRLFVDDPRDALMVGDSPADVLAAKQAGCRSIAALWGSIDPDALREAGPDFVATSPGDVLRVVQVEIGP